MSEFGHFRHVHYSDVHLRYVCQEEDHTCCCMPTKKTEQEVDNRHQQQDLDGN